MTTLPFTNDRRSVEGLLKKVEEQGEKVGLRNKKRAKESKRREIM